MAQSNSPRSSKWRRNEVMKLMQMAGWSIRKGGEGHIIVQSGDKIITLGSDPVHMNGIAEVEKALGIHIEKVIQKQKGKATSARQIEKRLILARQMSAAGFDSKKVMQQCSLGGLYSHGFSYQMIRGTDADIKEYAESIYKSRMNKKGIKVRRAIEKDEGLPAAPTKRSSEDGDLTALLELLSTIDSKIDDRYSSAQYLAGSYAQRIQSGMVEIRHLKSQIGELNNTIDKIFEHLDLSALSKQGIAK